MEVVGDGNIQDFEGRSQVRSLKKVWERVAIIPTGPRLQGECMGGSLRYCEFDLRSEQDYHICANTWWRKNGSNND